MTLKTQKTPQYMTLKTQKTPQYRTLKTQKNTTIYDIGNTKNTTIYDIENTKSTLYTYVSFLGVFCFVFFKYDRYITLQLLLPHSCETYYVENLFRFL